MDNPYEEQSPPKVMFSDVSCIAIILLKKLKPTKWRELHSMKRQRMSEEWVVLQKAAYIFTFISPILYSGNTIWI